MGFHSPRNKPLDIERGRRLTHGAKEREAYRCGMMPPKPVDGYAETFSNSGELAALHGDPLFYPETAPATRKRRGPTAKQALATLRKLAAEVSDNASPDIMAEVNKLLQAA